MEEIAFHQWSDIGRICCRVTVSIGVCDVCHAKSVDPGADKILDEAFQREYDKAVIARPRDFPDTRSEFGGLATSRRKIRRR
jgi:hypothetical protein